MNEALLQFQALLPSALRHEPWLEDLSLRQHDLPARTVLYRPGASPRRLYFVARGWVAKSIPIQQHASAMCALRIRGDVIGLNCLNGRAAVEQVTTVTAAELVSVPFEEFEQHMRKRPALLDFTSAEMIRDLANLQLMNTVIGRMKAPDRLAYFLYLMLLRTRRTYHGHMDTLSLPLTQEEIGQLLGLTNVSVNRAFRTLESEQLIRTGRQSVTFVDESRFGTRLPLEEWKTVIGQIVEREMAA